MKEVLRALADGRALAAKADRVGLIFRPEIPQGVLCFLKEKDLWQPAPSRKLQDGMLLVRDLPVEVEVGFESLHCRDAGPFSMELKLQVRAQTDPDSLQLLACQLLRAREHADLAFLGAVLHDEMLPVLTRRLGQEEARSLFFGAKGQHLIQEVVQETSKRLSFKYGLLLGQVLGIRYGGKVYEEKRMEEEAAERRAEIVRRLKEECDISTDLAAQIASGLRTEGLTCAKTLFFAMAAGVGAMSAVDAAAARANIKTFTTKPTRSVRLAELNNKTVLLAGTTDGVKMLSPALEFLREYGFEEARHGFNSACILGDSLFATHSQFGLVRWPILGGKPEVLRHEPCRGVTTDGNFVYFATSKKVMRFGTPPKLLFECTFSVNALVLAPPFLVAGTNDGRLYFFNLNDSSLTWFETGAKIYSLAVAELQRGDSVLVGARTEGVRGVTLLLRDVVEFACGERIRWVAGASDYVFGVGYGLKTLYVWQTDKKLSPQRVSLPHETYDICLLKEGKQ